MDFELCLIYLKMPNLQNKLAKLKVGKKLNI